MTRVRTTALVILLLLAAAGGFVEHRHVAGKQAQLAARQARIDRIEATLRQERQLLEKATRELADLDREIVTTRRGQAAAEAESSLKLWANRITLLKRLLEEMPAQSIPELRLLAPVDWVQVVRNLELDRSDHIRTALAALRALGRRKFSEKLQEALRRFTTDSGGELPGDILQLAPFLSAPADAEMLQRYGMARTGRLGATDEILIKEKPVADMIMSVGLQTSNINHNSEWQPPVGEDPGALQRNMAAFGVAFGDDGIGDMKEMASLFSKENIEKLVDRIKPQLEQLESSSGTKIGEELKQAVQRFGAERGGEIPSDFAQILPYLKDADKLVVIVRPFFAEMEYMRDHQGQVSTEPAQLRRYLEAPFDPAKALRDLKIKIEGSSFTCSFNFSWGQR